MAIMREAAWSYGAAAEQLITARVVAGAGRGGNTCVMPNLYIDPGEDSPVAGMHMAEFMHDYVIFTSSTVLSQALLLSMMPCGRVHVVPCAHGYALRHSAHCALSLKLIFVCAASSTLLCPF